MRIEGVESTVFVDKIRTEEVMWKYGVSDNAASVSSQHIFHDEVLSGLKQSCPEITFQTKIAVKRIFPRSASLKESYECPYVETSHYVVGIGPN